MKGTEVAPLRPTGMKRFSITAPVWITAVALGFLTGCTGTQTASPPLAETSAPTLEAPPPAASPTPLSEPAQTPPAACDPAPEGQVGEPCYDTGPAQEELPYDSGNAPRSFTQRASLPSCGTYDLGHRPTPSVAIDCFAAALGDPEGAEYAVSRSTTEGDPIVNYYRALPGQPGVIVFTDSTRGDFGQQEWTQFTCRGYDPTVADVIGCDYSDVVKTRD